MEAPHTGPANMASNATTLPTAMAAVMPSSFAPVDTLRMTNIRISVRITSNTNDAYHSPAGSVAPRSGWEGNIESNRALARIAPQICDST